jgi:hypothetical protein
MVGTGPLQEGVLLKGVGWGEMGKSRVHDGAAAGGMPQQQGGCTLASCHMCLLIQHSMFERGFVKTVAFRQGCQRCRLPAAMFASDCGQHGGTYLIIYASLMPSRHARAYLLDAPLPSRCINGGDRAPLACMRPPPTHTRTSSLFNTPACLCPFVVTGCIPNTTIPLQINMAQYPAVPPARPPACWWACLLAHSPVCMPASTLC